MDISQLETFVTVADNKSFTKAADSLFVTQPTVSNHISNLERDLDTVLFIRTRKNVSLTRSGQLLYNHAVNIINAYNNMTTELKSFNDNFEGHLNIYASSIPRKFFLPSLLGKFSRQYPDIRYSLLNEDSMSVIDRLLAGETDFGFVGMKTESAKLEYYEILEDELVFVTSQKWDSFDGSKYISAKDIVRYPLLVREEGSGTRNLFESELKGKLRFTYKENIIATVEDPATLLEMVDQGLGSTIISSNEVKSDSRFNIYKIEDFDLKRKFYFTYNKDMQYVPVNKVFRNYMLNHISFNNLTSCLIDDSPNFNNIFGPSEDQY